MLSENLLFRIIEPVVAIIIANVIWYLLTNYKIKIIKK